MMSEVQPTAAGSMISHEIYLDPFSRYVVYVEANPVATGRDGAMSNLLLFTTNMSGLYCLQIAINST